MTEILSFEQLLFLVLTRKGEGGGGLGRVGRGDFSAFWILDFSAKRSPQAPFLSLPVQKL